MLFFWDPWANDWQKTVETIWNSFISSCHYLLCYITLKRVFAQDYMTAGVWRVWWIAAQMHCRWVSEPTTPQEPPFLIRFREEVRGERMFKASLCKKYCKKEGWQKVDGMFWQWHERWFQEITDGTGWGRLLMWNNMRLENGNCSYMKTSELMERAKVPKIGINGIQPKFNIHKFHQWP